MSSLEALLRTGFYNSIPAERNQKGDEVQRKLIELLRDFKAKAQAASANGDLSAEGVQKSIADLAEKAFADIALLEKHSLFVTDARRSVEASLAKVLQAGEETPTDATHIWAIRDRLERLSTTQRLEALHQAIKDGDDQVYRAFVDAPKFMALLNTDSIDKYRDEWARMRDPEKASQLVDLRQVEAILAENIHDVRNGIKKIAGMGESLRDRLATV